MKKIQKGHQGDVQFKEVSIDISNFQKIPKKVLALGEHSGHCHILTGDYELYESPDKKTFAKIGNDGAILQHIYDKNIKFDANGILPKADHYPVEIKPNIILQIALHKQYDPFEKTFREVMD